MLTMPTLETARVIIRPFVGADLPDVHRLLDVDLAEADMGNEGAQSLDARRRWLDWTVLNYEQLAQLYQPPYGDRAIVSRESGALIGACGYSPCLGPYAQLPILRRDVADVTGLASTEFGLFWAVSPAQRRRGYATEAARALIDYAFDHLELGRIIATTTNDNTASIGVMKKLGMRVDRNPLPTPPWLQTVGVLTNPHAAR
ncbi:MAG TPA: GNAT family N-acetyltransferase [Thermomicrobiales bacterium]|jgi:ribosomal-protein-alanine N-acetyltransferase